MRVGAVRVHRDDGKAVRGDALLLPARPGELLQLALGGRVSRANAPGGFLRHRLHVSGDQLGGARLRDQLLGREHADDLRHQVRARDHLRTHRAHQLHRARIDAAQGGDLVARRVLHRHPLEPAQHRAQLAVADPPRRVDGGSPRHAVQRLRLDGVHQLLRLAPRRDQAVPAPRADPAGVEAQHPVGDLVGAAEIEEQPAVELVLLQRGLDARHPLGGEHRQQDGEDHSFPPEPLKLSRASRKSTLKVVKDP